VVHIVVVGYIVDHYYFRFDRGVVHIVVAGYIVDHYCVRLGRELVCIVVAAYIVDHHCFRGVIASNGQQYCQPQQYEPPLCQT
jgi:hypothetical protein